jgi:ribonuclease P protein component
MRSLSEFRKTFQKGRRIRGNGVNLLFLRQGELECSLWGIAVGRKFGKAHDRNQAKRWVREAIRHRIRQFPKGFLLIVEILPIAKSFSAKGFQGKVKELLDHGLTFLQVPRESHG